MKRALVVFALLAVVLLTASCVSKTQVINEHGAYKEYLQTQTTLDNNWAAAVKSIVDSADQCDNDVCRTAKSGMAAMALMSRPQGAANLQPFKREPSTGEKILLSLTGQATGLLGTAANAAVAIRQSDNATEASNVDSNNRAAIALGGFNALRDSSIAASSRVTNSYTVGGNLGDTYGNDFTGGNREETNVGRDLISGEQTNNSGIIGDENTQRNNSDDLENVGNCVAGAGGNGAPGASGGNGGNAGTGGENAAGVAGDGAPGAPGGNGGNGGNCVGIGP